ncbi:MAG: DUF998 domain-containing protein [Sphingomonas sp.]|uniref:DUF998 domain-containing protein n=1 Tax=Sphingomonas sp. TaxID=28214 RepID=UPI00181E6DAB|nr:DUF998 domain-containing protein [Sphingomonas sp.]MBA3667482.1 DUF998 domain-containing protein [Sphingomonas sp.]
MMERRFLLFCGVALCPMFYVAVLVQSQMRAGFDLTRHPLSLLSLGDAGWIQIANFLLAGLLAIACAAGMRQSLRGSIGGFWGPLLIATFGIGMIIAGLFPSDPLPGFPPGAVSSMPTQISGHAIGHGVGFFVAFLSLTSACFVFARMFLSRSERGWRLYSVATGLATPILIAVGMGVQRATSLSFFAVGIIAFGWIAAVSLWLMRRPPSDGQVAGRPS